jgi:hypothetical protein
VSQDDEMPQRVEPEGDAEEVVFPWDHAAEAVETMRTLADALDTHASDRDDLATDNPGLEDWEGPFKDEFVTMWEDWLDDMTGPVSGLSQWLRSKADDIVEIAREVRQEQIRRNSNVMAPDGQEHPALDLLTGER